MRGFPHNSRSLVALEQVVETAHERCTDLRGLDGAFLRVLMRQLGRLEDICLVALDRQNVIAVSHRDRWSTFGSLGNVITHSWEVISRAPKCLHLCFSPRYCRMHL